MVQVQDLEAQAALLAAELAQLQQEILRLKQEKADLQIALSTTAEHGDLVEEQLHETTIQLKAEIVERKRVEAMLQTLVEMIARERDDLEIILQTIMEHGDAVDSQWQVWLGRLLQERNELQNMVETITIHADVADAEWQEKLAEANRRAILDELTQIANRRQFDDYLQTCWEQMLQTGLPLSLILCDVDCFKLYNDTYGHLAGDACLQQVAQAFQKTLKQPGDMVARYGGEEFGVILPQTHEAGAIATARRLQQAIARLAIPHAASLVLPQVTVSFGVSTLPLGSDSPETLQQHAPSLLLDRADRHLYQAKRNGRNQVGYAPGNDGGRSPDPGVV